MANRYWVGNAGTWSQTAHWSDTSGGAGGFSVPTSADDVYFDNLSFTLASQTVQILSTAAYCNNLNSSTATNNALLSLASANLIIGGSLTMGGMRLQAATGRTIYFTSADTDETITIGGKQILAPCYFSGTGKWTYQDDSPSGNTDPAYMGTLVTLFAGELDFNNHIVSMGSLVIAGSATLTMGSGYLKMMAGTSGGDLQINSGVTGFTINAGTSKIKCRAIRNRSSTNVDLYDVYIICFQQRYPKRLTIYPTGGGTYSSPLAFDTDVLAFTGFTSFHDLEIHQVRGTKSATESIEVGNDFTVSGTLTIIGDDASYGGIQSFKRIFLYSDTPGIQRTITAAAVSLDTVMFLDIVGAGAAVPFTGTYLGDCGNNGGITFTAPTTRYWVGNGGNWSDSVDAGWFRLPTHWSTSSGGASGASLPLPQDTVRFDNLSFTVGLQIVVCDTMFLGGNIDWSGVTNSPKWQPYKNAGTEIWDYARYFLIFGNLTLDAGMSLTGSASSDYAYLTMSGRGAKTVRCNGINLGGTSAVSYNVFLIDVGNGSVELQDTFISWNLRIRSGTLNSNNNNLTLQTFTIGWAEAQSITYLGFGGTVNMGSGTWSFNNSSGGQAFNWVNNLYGISPVINCDTSTIEVNAGKFYTFFNIASGQYGGATLYEPTLYNIIIHGTGVSANSFIFGLPNGNFTMHNLTGIDPRFTFTFLTGRTYTVTNILNVNGSLGKLATFTATGVAYLSAAVATVSYIDVKNNYALGVAIPFNDSVGGVDSGGNTNWFFFPSGVTGQVSWF